MDAAHRQREYGVRFDWGLQGALAVAADVDIAVVVDVLSFTTTVSVALDAGTAVLPYRWDDEHTAAFAAKHGAALAGPRSVAGSGAISLSPASFRVAPVPARVVLPSPNGSTIAHHLGSGSALCVAAALRNAAAVARWVRGRQLEAVIAVAVIAAGEQWSDGSLRPAAEDLWGAGAVISGLADGTRSLSPEAKLAAAGYEAVRNTLPSSLRACASGRELIARGYRADVDIAAEVGRSAVVPVLRGYQFVAESPGGAT